MDNGMCEFCVFFVETFKCIGCEFVRLRLNRTRYF